MKSFLGITKIVLKVMILRQILLTCNANFCIKNFSAFLNFIPPPTIKIEEYIFFFISSVGQDSMLFKMAWSMAIKSDLSPSSVFAVRLTTSSLIMSNSSSMFCEASGSQPWEMSPAVVSPAFNQKQAFMKNLSRKCEIKIGKSFELSLGFFQLSVRVHKSR